MEDHKEGNGRVSVPAFGEWEQRKSLQYYSRQFSQVREARQQGKANFAPANVENDSDLRRDQQQHHPLSHQHDHRRHRNRRSQGILPRNRFLYTKIKKIVSYFIKPKIIRCFSGKA